MEKTSRMTRQQIIEETGVVAVVRLDDYSQAAPIARALVRGGVRAVEFTFTNPQAGEAIASAKQEVGDDGYIGAGTVLDPETARFALLSGAEYVVTPTTKAATIEVCSRYGIPTIIGAFTATEMLTAQEAGATYIKVHPASLGGPRYFKDILAPLPQLRLIPSGGVSLENASDFIQAGAVAVALGSNLVSASIVAKADWTTLEETARKLVAAVGESRSRSS